MPVYAVINLTQDVKLALLTLSIVAIFRFILSYYYVARSKEQPVDYLKYNKCFSSKSENLIKKM